MKVIKFFIIFIYAIVFTNSCGVKGPPLPPIELRPDQVKESKQVDETAKKNINSGKKKGAK